MKQSDNKTGAQPEEVKPEAAKAEEAKSGTSKPKKTNTATKSTTTKSTTAKADGAKSGTSKPKTTTKAAKSEAAPVEEAKPVEEVKAEQPAEEVKAETAAAEASGEEAKTEAPAQEVKPEEKSEKRSFFSNKRNVAIVACAGAAAVALSLGLGLGFGLKKDDEKPEMTPFTAPTVTLNESVLSWTAIDDATNGYTIKFAETEKEMTVMKVSYDLLTDTSYLAEGANSLSVKVNATDTYLASAYSKTVTYNYTIAVQKFDAPTGLQITDNKLSWTAVEGAVTYTVKINDDETTNVTKNSLDLDTVKDKLVNGANTIAVKVDAVGAKNASDYSSPVTHNYDTDAEDRAAATAFDALVTAIDITADGAAEKLAEAKTAFKALSERAIELAEKVGELKEKDGNYFIALVNKIGTVTEDSGEVINAASDYYDTLLDNTAENVVSAKATLDQKNSEFLSFFDSYVAEFKAKVDAIVIENNSRGGVIDEAKTAIDAAEAYYNAQSAKVQSALNTLKKALDIKNDKFTAAVAAELDGFKALVDEALEIIEAQSSLTALTEKQTAISGYGLSEVNQATVDADAELTANIASIDTAIENWNTAISDAIEALKVDVTGKDDEAVIVLVDETITAFDNAKYPDYIKEAEAVKAEKAKTEGLRETAKENIRTAVDAIKTATEEVLENTEPNEENFAALEAQKAAIEGVDGAYASEYLDTLKIGEGENAVGLLEAVEKAMATMLATSVRTEGGEAYSQFGTTLKITLFKTFYNFRDEEIAATDSANAPKLTATGDTVTFENFQINGRKEYVAVITIENLGALGDDAEYTVTVGGKSTRTPIKFGEALKENPYFTPVDEVVDGQPTGFKKAFSDSGNFVMIFQGGCTAENYYLAVYNAGAIEKDGAFANFKEMPLATINLKNIKETYVDQNKPITREVLNRFIANELDKKVVGKTLSLRFMIYGETVTDGVSSFTAMNPSVISEAIDFSLVEEDKYYTLPVANINNSVGTDEKGTLYLVVDDRKSEIIDAVNASLADAGVTSVTLDADNYKNYLQMKIEIYNAEDENQTVLYTHYTEATFMGTNVDAIINEWKKNYFTEHGNVKDPDFKIGLHISYCAKPDTEITKYFPRATFAEAGITYNDADGQVKYEKELVLSKAEITLPDTAFRLNSAGDSFEFLRDEKNAKGDTVAGEVLKQGDALYLEIKFYVADGENETNVNYAYLFNVGGNAIIYKNKEDAGKEDVTAKLGVDIVTNAWISINAFKDFLVANYTVDGYTFRWEDGWTFTARYVLNPESENYLFGDNWSTPIAFDTVRANMPTHVQIGNDGNGNITFIRKPDGSRDGTVLSSGGAERVEYYFYQGEKSYEYCIFLKYNREDKKVALYYNDGTDDVFLADCKDAGDSWCDSATLVKAMNDYLTAKLGEGNFTAVTTDTLKDWTFVSKIIARDGSKVYAETEMESEGSWTYNYTPPVPEPEE